jgi:hypothetical protein
MASTDRVGSTTADAPPRRQRPVCRVGPQKADRRESAPTRPFTYVRSNVSNEVGTRPMPTWCRRHRAAIVNRCRLPVLRLKSEGLARDRSAVSTCSGGNASGAHIDDRRPHSSASPSLRRAGTAWRAIMISRHRCVASAACFDPVATICAALQGSLRSGGPSSLAARPGIAAPKS